MAGLGFVNQSPINSVVSCNNALFALLKFAYLPMSLSYRMDERLKALTPVLAEHAEWFGGVMGRLFYPEKFIQAGPAAEPQSFRQWAESARDVEFVAAATLEDLMRIHDELHQSAAGLIEEAMKIARKPDLEAFAALTDLYDEFVLQVHRLEKDCTLADNGLDVLTGLRNSKAMEKDLERELERRSRRGQPFCLVLARIDDFDQVRAEAGEQEAVEAIRGVAALVKKCVRSFDDAYRCADAEFVMALKHTDTKGGTAAINRLRTFLEETPVLARKGGKPAPVTLSYCAAEPLPGDKMDEMLTHMRQDLARYDEGGDTTVEYFEQSPLQRFIIGQDDEKTA